MTRFDYSRPGSPEEALALLARPGAFPLSGGTDLIPLVREGIARPSLVVDLRALPGAASISEASDGSLTIGGAVTLAAIAAHPVVRARFVALAEACSASGSAQLRNMGTIGGNLCQRPRCEYFRHGFACHRNGGTSCPAAAGDNRYHALFGAGACVAVHPSDPAVALTALEAIVHVAGAAGRREVAIADFFAPHRLDHETVLSDGEFVTAITLPARSSGGRQRYDKVMQRAAWEFALVSLAAVRRSDGEVRLVLGGVALRPWRVTDSVEEDVASGGLGEDDVETLAERALYDATPLEMNGYKVQIARSLLRRAMAWL